MRFKERVKSKKHYRIRRYACTICDFQETIYADGWIDDVVLPERALNQIKKEYKQSEDNQL